MVAGSNKDTKLRAFKKICLKFQPAFHNFFIEKFSSAVISFERRLAYIRRLVSIFIASYFSLERNNLEPSTWPGLLLKVNLLIHQLKSIIRTY